MNMKVTNKKIAVEELELGDTVRSSMVLIGDAEVITCTTIFDTPTDSLIFSPTVPLVPPTHELNPRARVLEQVKEITKKATPQK